MSISRVFSLLGDSNAKRHMNPTNCRDRPLMSGCQLVPCGRLSVLAECLKSVREDATVCLLSCLTNFLTGSASAGASISFRVEPIFLEVLETLKAAALERPNLQFLVSPPMYRMSPLWYRDNLPEILTKYSDVMRGRPANVHLLSSFPTPVLEDDGVHLTAYSGLEFVLHLFDSSARLLDALDATVEQVSVQNTESSRLLEDRMVAIEQDHRRLNQAFETKTAEDAELMDFHLNVKFESSFVIAGLAVIDEPDPREWQKKAKADVQGVLTILMGKEYDIVYILNNTSRKKDSPATYAVELRSVHESKAIRDKFGSYFLGAVDKRPEALKPYSIRIRATPETQVRVQILKLFAKRYHDSNPGSKVKVISYEPRPLLKLTPPPGASDSRVKTFTFVQAVKSLPANFSKSERDELLAKVSPRFYGRLRSLFVVISDDMLKPRDKSSGQGSSGSSASGSQPSGPTRSRSAKRGHSPGSSGGSGKSKKNK